MDRTPERSKLAAGILAAVLVQEFAVRARKLEDLSLLALVEGRRTVGNATKKLKLWMIPENRRVRYCGPGLRLLKRPL
jgi:hypothetical protein